jgi:predicted acylesterase/phospholipase RssA
MPPLYPQGVREVIDELEARGVPRARLLLLLKLAAHFNGEGAPLYVVIGAPMRGIRGSGELKQHLEVWRLGATVADALRLVLRTIGESEELQALGENLETAILAWADIARVDWCFAIEARQEVVVARDTDTPAAWFRDRVVAVWGCGALGGRVAESLVRAGVKRLALRDKAIVRPGILIRQPFADADIGRNKAEALADALRKIRPDLDITTSRGDIVGALDRPDWCDGADVLIDTTGSEAVLAKLELRRKDVVEGSRPAIAAMVIGHEARNGFAVVADRRHTGGPYDLSRYAKIWASSRPDLAHFADEFWPAARRKPFQPEPGCSEPTFVGSAADVGALAGLLLNHIAEMLRDESASGKARFISLPRLGVDALALAAASWDPHIVVHDPHAGYEVRISPEAFAELRAWVSHSARTAGAETETGGYLFGERDEATKILWISEASGPPPDSEASRDAFVCGIEGVEAVNSEKQQRTRSSVRLVGIWHAHPEGAPLPSPTDIGGISRVIADSAAPSARALMMIVGYTTDDVLMVGTYDFSREDVERMARGQFLRVCELTDIPPRPRRPKHVGLALSGGGARAIAFHLGCLRALNDRGILDQVSVISSVSGGSVIGAMYAYSEESFDVFDARVVALLRRGLLRGMGQAARRPGWLARTAATIATAGVAAKAADGGRWLAGRAARIPSLHSLLVLKRLRSLQPPFARHSSRTDLLEATLRDEVFGDRTMTSARRGGIDVVVNACELRSGSAFRFGSRESGCWRYGRVAANDTIEVAHAVAASAAYPALLPALDRTMTFISRTGAETRRRVLLTDGGIFDNLGTSCLEPGRDGEISTNVFHPDYIVACDAGPGLFADDAVPYWWPTRMMRAFDSVFRKAGNAAYDRLHRLRSTRAIQGFVLAYLGQRDTALPYQPANLVPRDAVMTYPTDFAPMADDDIRRLAARGEQLTRLLIEYYCPEL